MTISGLVFSMVLETKEQLQAELDDLRAEIFAMRGEFIRSRALQGKVKFLTLKEVAKEANLPKAEILRLQRDGKIRGYLGSQPKKKRYFYVLEEVIAAVRREKARETGKPAFDIRELFSRHNIPRERALSGVSA